MTAAAAAAVTERGADLSVVGMDVVASAELDVTLAEEACDAAAHLVAEAVVRAFDDVDLLVREYVRARALLEQAEGALDDARADRRASA